MKLPGLKLIDIKIYNDDRGFFVERYKAEWSQKYGLPTFVQDNHSRSKPGVIRGLHYQAHPAAQSKLVGVLRGRIWDVVVDLRANSPTFGQWDAVELSDVGGKLLWIPAGFAHGFCVLGNEEAEVMYKVDAPYQAAAEGGIRYDDPTLKILWPFHEFKAAPLISEKDKSLPTFEQYRSKPVF